MKKDFSGLMALKKARELDVLIKRLEATTIGELDSRVSQLEVRVTTLESDFNSHTHSYTDKSIADTVDGSGTETTEIKRTGDIS